MMSKWQLHNRNRQDTDKETDDFVTLYRACVHLTILHNRREVAFHTLIFCSYTQWSWWMSDKNR